MKEQFASELFVNQEVLDFFMVKSCGIKVGSNGKQYFDIMLGDKTGEVTGKKWDVQEIDVPKLEAIQEGDIVRIKGVVTEWQGAKQIRVLRIRKAVVSDGVDIKEYVKSAPENSLEMFNYIYGVAESMEDNDLKTLITKVLDENKDKLIYYPAASRNHHAMYGGLLYHTKCMLMNGLYVCKVYTYLNRDLLAAGVILHDIMKIEEIESNEYGVSPGYSMEGRFLGHLVMGVKYVDKMTTELNFPREKALMLEQMILSHHYEPEFGSPVRPLFPEGEVLHYLDILDARLMDMQNALSTTEPGHFSERVWTLDNRSVYKPEDAE